MTYEEEELQSAKTLVRGLINQFRTAWMNEYFTYDGKQWDCDDRGVTNIFDYGFVFFFSAIENNPENARRLAKLVDDSYKVYDEVVVIGHSNGCAVMELAAASFQKCDHYTYLDPALESGNSPGYKVRSTDVWFNQRDGVLKLTEIARQIPQWMFKKLQWGKMGITGYIGNDNTITNNEISVERLNWMQQHSAWYYFKPTYCTKICDTVLNRLL